MTHTNFLLLAFLLQTGVISAFIPRLINNRFKHMMKNHPPAQYPKLYPMLQVHMQK